MWGEVRRMLLQTFFLDVLFSSIFGGKWSNLTDIFQMRWNHQPVFFHHRFFLVWYVYRLSTCRQVIDISISISSITCFESFVFVNDECVLGHRPPDLSQVLFLLEGLDQQEDIWWCLPLVESSFLRHLFVFYGSHPAHQVFCWLDLHIITYYSW